MIDGGKSAGSRSSTSSVVGGGDLAAGQCGCLGAAAGAVDLGEDQRFRLREIRCLLTERD